MGEHLADTLKAEAGRLGFDMVGIAPAVAPEDIVHLRDWLDQGCAAGMDYMSRQADARAHPDSILDGVKSIVMVGMVYGDRRPEPDDEDQGKVARYAQGTDYHTLIWKRLELLKSWLETQVPGVRVRAVADTAPLLERDFARRSGLGWIGKNTMLIHPKLGSFTLLGALLADINLAPDAPFEFDRCGTCTRCLDACPTDAFVAPHRLDARKCISYWTIEHRGPMPEEMADSLNGWVFGCDICQDVCPWNRKAPPGREPLLASRPEWVNPDLVAWLDHDESAWQMALKGTALKRAKRVGLIRNACLVLGTRRVARAIPALRRLQNDADPTVRWAASWALTRITDGQATEPEPEIK